MSDARAIEAVTETLRALVDDGVKTVLPGAKAVVQPPHEVNPAAQEAQVNLFLYQAEVIPALRNEPPADVNPGETGEPALPLVLRYLMTPFAPDGDDLVAHRLLGGALQALHTRPVLTRAELTQVASYSDVARQPDSIRITWHAVEEKDIYSLWSVFQTPYRLTTSFEVRAVLIDSRRAPRTPAPVLKRGADDRGPEAGADVRSTTPDIDTVRYPLGQPAARVGEEAELSGSNLSSVTAVRLTHLTSGVAVAVPAAPAGPDSVRLTVPGGIPAGVSAVALLAGTPPSELPVGPWYLAVAPRIASPMPASVARDGSGAANVTLTVSPAFVTGQKVALVLGGDTYPALSAAGNTATFVVPHAHPGDHAARLRVDGVDSILVLDRTANPPVYDPTQLVKVT